MDTIKAMDQVVILSFSQVVFALKATSPALNLIEEM